MKSVVTNYLKLEINKFHRRVKNTNFFICISV